MDFSHDIFENMYILSYISYIQYNGFSVLPVSSGTNNSKIQPSLANKR